MVRTEDDPVAGVEGEHDPQSLTDMQQELRILLPGAQILTAFLAILPFNTGFERVQRTEQWIYLAAFASSLASLIFFSAPAARHRLARPLIGVDRLHYKAVSNRLIVVGLVALSLGLALVTHVVVNEIIAGPASTVAAFLVLLLIGVVWWSAMATPLRRRGWGHRRS